MTIGIQPAPHTTDSRRLKILTVSWELFRGLFTDGEHVAYRVVQDAIPAGAVLVNARYAWPHCVELLIHSSSFPETKEGDAYPRITPVCALSPNNL